jgi:hypothetical protein
MAHSCPECGQACYCNGDIDDCLLDDEAAVIACTCCPDGCDDEDFDYDVEVDLDDAGHE